MSPLATHGGRSRLPRLCVLLVSVLALALPTAVAVLTTPAAADDFVLELDHGHVDAFALTQSEGALRVRLQEDVTGSHVLHDPAEVLLRVTDQARYTLPDPVPPSLSFVGGAGSTVYLLPQTQDSRLIWPGWSTERLSGTDFRSPMRLHIDRVDGPGRVLLWQTGAFGASRSVLESAGYALPGVIPVDVPAHVHANWAFTAPGRYVLTVRASGTRTDGTRATSDPVTYTFHVGAGGATPSAEPTTDPTTSPSTSPSTGPDLTPTPEPDGVWNVPNGTVNRHGATVLNAGHVDVASRLDGDALDTSIKDTTRSSAPVWRDPATTVMQLLPSSRTTVPAIAAYSFLGSPGTPLFQVTQVQQPGLLWPGWSTEAIPAAATTGGVLWSLTDVSGPGTFSLYETDALGQPTVLMSTHDGITGADRFTIPKSTHAHGSWAFSHPGRYCLSMQRVAETAAGTAVSDQFVLSIAVGPVDVMGVDPAACQAEVDTDAPVPDPPKPDRRGQGKSTGADAATGAGGSGSAAGQDECASQIRTQATVLSSGHIDYASRIVGGRLQSQVGDDTSGSKTYRDPSETILWLKPSAEVRLPTGYEQVGAPGTVVWQVPQTQNPALIWLGWNTETLNSGNARGQVHWRLDRVEGPGTVKVYLSGAFGGVQSMVLSGPGSAYSIDLGVHAHANWAFSKQGIYRLTTTQSVTLADGTRSSDTEVLTVAVGDVDPASALHSEGGCDAAAAMVREDGEAGALAAAPQAMAPAATQVGVSPATDAGVTEAQRVASATEASDPVPILLGTLGALLLLGSGGTGVLWLRRPLRAPRAAA